MMKLCGKCGTKKDYTAFNKSSIANDGHQSQCRECHNKHVRKYKRNPDVDRITRWLDPEELVDSIYGTIRYKIWAEKERIRIGNCKIVRKNDLIALYKG